MLADVNTRLAMKTAFHWRGAFAPKVVCCTALSGRPPVVLMRVPRVARHPSDTAEIRQRRVSEVIYGSLRVTIVASR